MRRSRRFSLRATDWPRTLLPVVVAVGLFSHLPLAPHEPANRDGITFADGIAAYDVTLWRPHWPGYPVTILAGKLVNLFVGEPYAALRLLVCLCTALSVLPLAALASDLASQRGETPVRAAWTGLGAAALWVALPASWLDGTEMFSDPVALLLGLTMLALLARGEARLLPWAGLAGALTVGARLDYLFLLAPLAFRLWTEPDRGAARRSFGAAVGGVAAWWGWQLAMDGWGWFQAAGIFNLAYWSDWGGSSLTDPGAGLRPLRLVRTFLRFPLGAWWPGEPWLRLLPTLFLALCLPVGLRRAWHTPTARVLGLAAGPYLLWIGVAHSVDLSRYTLPFAAFVVVLLVQGLPRAPKWAASAMGLGLGASLLVAVPLARRHEGLTPLAIQASRTISARLDPERTVVLLSAPSSFLPRYAPRFQTLILEEGRAEAQVEAELVKGRTLVATRDLLIGNRLSITGWRPLADLSVDPTVVSRGPWALHLYVREPESGR